MADPLLDILVPHLSEDVATNLSALSRSNLLADYLQHVRGLSVSQISTETTQLSTSLQAVDRSLTTLAINSRPHLISTSATLESFTERFNSLAISLPSLSQIIPELESNVSQFHPVNDRQASATLLSNVDKVLDILELPSLVLTCVRNGYYAEALDLVGHVRRLAIRYKNVKVIEMIQAEVDDALLEMTTLLLRLLRENVQLPTAIKVISYLRRLQPFQASPNPTLELQHIYLLSRVVHLKSQLQSLDPLKSIPEKYLKRYIELFREFVFAAIIGFRSIFPKEGAKQLLNDGSSALATQLATTKDGSENQESTSVVDAGDQLLSSFIYHTAMDLKRTVMDMLPLIPDKSSYAALYLQVIYSSQSLARVGGEFWGIMADETDRKEFAAAKENNPWVAALEKQRDLAKKLKSY
ncbi:oligomeric Golgi complex subunit 8 [Lipomyces tetrasporus]|uniref:Conserved oligomeric Golgi complex subunit 8 n=1 Tax=Lipomyces tetrasporus TaxID=54092 RepID=A0AAD7QLN9_9ASCO|nr:oligomeric Golgi complex subunit 8 [Lipomyces tetrasporus]KAJ8097587.1 oligomeric Golgi complex subunit 8 [Lipomyces tetrasporus]